MKHNALVKIHILVLFIIAFAIQVTAKDRTIENPAVEFTTSGITHVTKIELGKKETRVHVHSVFIPHWWVKFGKNTFIQDSETGEKWTATRIEGTEFDKETYMPDSGDSTFVLIFPPLNKTVKKINFGENDETGDLPTIYGISLNPKDKQKDTSEIPAPVQQWLDKAVNTPKNSPCTGGNDFFCTDSVYITGYIKGYDARAGFSTGIVYTSNELTREDYPTVIQIHPDGRFEATYQANHPYQTSLKIGDNCWIPYYAKPGQALSVVLDWKEFLLADRMRNIRYTYRDIIFGGASAQINAGLLQLSIEKRDYRAFEKNIKTMTPEDYLNEEKIRLNKNLEKLQQAEKEGTVIPEVIRLMRSDAWIDFGYSAFDYVLYRKSYAQGDSANTILRMPLPDTYYDFLQQMPLNDPYLLTSNESSIFINRLEFADFYNQIPNPIIRSVLGKTFLDYLQEENIPLTKEEIAWGNWYWGIIRKPSLSKDDLDELKKNRTQTTDFFQKYAAYQESYALKYPTKTTNPVLQYLATWHGKDSILTQVLKVEPNLIHEITKIRSLSSHFTNLEKEDARNFLTALKKDISVPFLQNEAERIFDTKFPSEVKSYELPNDKAAGIFRKIIDPFKGKLLFVDFWATTCGPCVSSIRKMKETRDQYDGNPDFDFIFITDEKASPLNAYDKMLEEQGNMNHSFRLTEDEFNYLRQLFKFNGIPRYVVIDKEGRVLNDDFAMHNFNYELKKLLVDHP